MPNAKVQLNYFENLENTIKIGLAVYLTIFVIGLVASFSGFAVFSAILPSNGVIAALGGIVLISAIFVSIYYSVGKVSWLGELHIRIDKRFFGFLVRSNNAIFNTLVSSLHRDDRYPFSKLSETEQATLSKTVLNKLADDYRLFALLLDSGIFRSWIKYWVSIYGTFVFLLLTCMSFIGMAISGERDHRLIFSVCWTFAVTHLITNVVWGKYMVKRTEGSVQQMVDTHGDEISRTLQQSLPA
jgi:hypothetical protein